MRVICSRTKPRLLLLSLLVCIASFKDTSVSQSIGRHPISRYSRCAPPKLTVDPELAPTGPQAQLFIERRPTAGELAQRDTHARFEPPIGCYLGAFIDFDGSLPRTITDQNHTPHHDPGDFEQIVSRAHAMFFFYLGYGQRLPLDWVRWLGQHNKFVHIALEPNAGLEKVNDNAYLRRLAADMRSSGAKIFLRFGSEMNGPWTHYHRDPALYRKKFRLIYQVMHRSAPNVALVWCPYFSPTRTIPDYYPGDDATDWVGVNLYNVTYHDEDLNQPAEGEHPCDLLRYVYKRYSQHKPMMVCEFAATHYASCDDKLRPDFAFRKILTLYTALPRLFPRVKCINYFDSNNIRFASHANNDYSVTNDPTVTYAYHTAVAPAYYLDRPLTGRPGELPALIPLPMRQGEALQGRVRLSCWARTPSDFVTVVYQVDGKTIYRADRPDLWECDWNAGSVTPGPHLMTLEVYRPDGKRVISQSVHFVARE